MAWSAAAVLWTGSLVLAVAPLAHRQGVSLWSPSLSRAGAAVATWLAVVLLARRIAGPVLPVAVLTAAALAAALALSRGWALTGSAVVAGTTYGLLGMTMTRPAAGARALRESLVALVIGAVGAVVVTGYGVGVRPYRFRMTVLALTLLTALVLAWRLGLGFRSLGRRGTALIAGAVVVLVMSVVYVQLVRHWGSSEVVESLTGTKGNVRQWIGASPRPLEALVGFPALVWGSAVRYRRRQGWWMSAVGSLAAAGIATALVQPTVGLREAAEATGYGVVIGGALGLLLIGLDKAFTGSGRRSHAPTGADPRRVEPARTGSLV